MFRVQVLLFWMTKKSVVVLLLNLKEDANASLVMFVIVMILRQFACDLETLLMLMYCNLWCSCVCNDILRCWLILVWMISVSKLRQSIHWINVFEHLLIFGQQKFYNKTSWAKLRFYEHWGRMLSKQVFQQKHQKMMTEKKQIATFRSMPKKTWIQFSHKSSGRNK